MSVGRAGGESRYLGWLQTNFEDGQGGVAAAAEVAALYATRAQVGHGGDGWWAACRTLGDYIMTCPARRVRASTAPLPPYLLGVDGRACRHTRSLCVWLPGPMNRGALRGYSPTGSAPPPRGALGRPMPSL